MFSGRTTSSKVVKSSRADPGLEGKLPKLTITKFDHSFQDWPRFLGQYHKMIDKSAIASISKFAYLRELLCVKVWKSIKALPFTPEGYNRVKSTLVNKYGKESEIIKACSKEILELQATSGVNVKKIHEFSDCLTYCIQLLESCNK